MRDHVVTNLSRYGEQFFFVHLQRLSQEEGVVFVTAMFAIILVLYTAMKLIHLGLAALVPGVRAGRGAEEANLALAA